MVAEVEIVRIEAAANLRCYLQNYFLPQGTCRAGAKMLGWCKGDMWQGRSVDDQLLLPKVRQNCCVGRVDPGMYWRKLRGARMGLGGTKMDS